MCSIFECSLDLLQSHDCFVLLSAPVMSQHNIQCMFSGQFINSLGVDLDVVFGYQPCWLAAVAKAFNSIKSLYCEVMSSFRIGVKSCSSAKVENTISAARR